MKKQFAVIGLGRFGFAVAAELERMGYDVLAVDSEEATVESASAVLSHCVQADCTDEPTITQLGMKEMDVVIVAVGDTRASVMVTLLLTELGVPVIVAKSNDDIHKKLLEKIGATRIICPESEMGTRVAHSLVNPGIVDVMDLSRDYRILECATPQSWTGQSLRELDCRRRFNINVIGIRDKQGRITVSPSADNPLCASDVLIMLGPTADVTKLERTLAK